MAFSLAGLVFCSGLCFSSAFLSSRRYRNPVPLFPSVDEHWFDQKLDHFNGAESRVWKQRFFINDTFYDGGPVFLMIGGEGPANPAWMVSGTWLRYAEKLKALCLLLEHRFYGKSHPTEDMRTANLQYLSSKQALADLAHFQTVMTQKLKLSHSKWVAFGGSYPGSLATWYRLKYPHLIYAAVATSAPVYALINFTEYLEVVQTSLADYNSECPKAVKSASDTLVMMLKKKENYVKITEDFKLCEILQINSEMDSAYFLETLAGNFMDVVQYNNDNRAFEGVKGTNITIQVLCEIMADVSLGTPYDRYAAVAHLMMDALEMKCMDTSYKKYVQEMTSATWEGPAAVGVISFSSAQISTAQNSISPESSTLWDKPTKCMEALTFRVAELSSQTDVLIHGMHSASLRISVRSYPLFILKVQRIVRICIQHEPMILPS
ncbi:putative serine protease K12H4.7 isoform X2 [Rhinatrema bivittatum]|uniref:putative serine protease K12H4.7 isoform X2 n=1 Tax=Rhinatrema bivittatum TaxID=194408 RepID=UPI001128E3FB|nr:putative serine protease K12H4.7 isoform X2 [Rhinatrema bivittatum]